MGEALRSSSLARPASARRHSSTTAVRAARRHVQVKRMVAAESEMELAYAGLQFLCGSFMARPSICRHRNAMRSRRPSACGSARPRTRSWSASPRSACSPRPPATGGLLSIIDDAQWLDAASARAIAFVARRLEAEGVAIVLAMRTVAEPFTDLPRLIVEGLADADARDSCARRFPDRSTRASASS